MDIGKMTVKEVQKWLDDLTAEAVKARDRVETARRRIHEFAPSTREYEFAEQSQTLDDIDQSFYDACRSAPDPSAMAARFGVPEEVIRDWAAHANPTNIPTAIRLEVERDGKRVSYALPFRQGNKAKARDLMLQFSETLARKGWTLISDAAGHPAPDDVLLAEV